MTHFNFGRHPTEETRKKLRESHRKFPIDEHIFDEIDTEEKAYYLGFIYADGYISKNGYYLALDISKIDEYILDRLQSLIYLGSNRPIKGVRKNFTTGKEYVRVVISSSAVVASLIKHGVTSNKTFAIRFPTWIRPDIRRHFIRGYFDGDGTITNNKMRPFFSIVSNQDFVTSLLCVLKEECGIGELSVHKSVKTSDIYKFTVTKYTDIDNIYHYLYDDSNIYLTRKQTKFACLVEAISKCPAFHRKKHSTHTGVTFDKTRGLWIAYYKRKFLGRFETETDAYNARLYYEKTGFDTKN
jgi:DNA-binding transcriptional regulator WhiA